MRKQQGVKERVNRRHIPSLLARKYMKDYETALAEFPENKKAELLEHMLECLDVIETYMSSPSKENWKTYVNKENTFLKKHGKRLKMYHQNRMHLYYGDSTLLIEKDIYTPDEWNALSPDQQKLSSAEYADFIHLCRNSLYLERQFLLLRQAPEDEREETLSGKPLADEKTSRKRKITRDAHDKLTCLNQEQTALLVYYLQQEKVFLKGEYLNDKEIGAAIETLTGYSQHTIRQTLGKFTKSLSKENLKEIDNLLTRVKIVIGRDLKEK